MGELVVIEVTRAEGFLGRPVGVGDRNFNPAWWSSDRRVLDTTLRLRAELDGVEVARVELDANPRQGPSGLGPVREIYFIEVGIAHRGRGIGGRVVERLVARFRDARLIATSDVAAGWWASLNWTRFEHPEMRGDWAAFVSPEL